MELTKEELEKIISFSQIIAFKIKNIKGFPFDYISDNVKIFGYTADLFYQRKIKIKQLIHTEDLEKLYTQLNRHFKDRNDELICNFRVMSKSYSIHYIEMHIWGDLNSEGLISDYQGLVIDITKQKQAEREINFLSVLAKEYTDKNVIKPPLETLLQQIRKFTGWDYGEIWKPNYEINALEFLFADYSDPKYRKFELASRKFSFAPNIGLPGRIWVTKKIEKYYDVSIISEEIYIRSREVQDIGLKACYGVPIIVDNKVESILVLYLSRIHDADAIMLIIDLIVDFVYNRDFYKSKIIKQELMENEVKETQTLINILTHDLKGYSNNIKLIFDELNQTKNDKNSEIIVKGKSNINLSINLINNVTFILKEKIKATYGYFNVNIIQVISESIENLKEIYPSLKLNINTNFPKQKLMIRADDLIGQLFMNIFTNAVKYNENEIVQIDVIVETTNNTIKVQIDDYGKGINPIDRKNLFQKYSQYRKLGFGSGLGLFIVQSLAKSYGAEVLIEDRIHGEWQKGIKVVINFKKLLMN